MADEALASGGSDSLKLWAACSPGLEALVRRELSELGVAPADDVRSGGVSFETDDAGLLLTSLGLGCALFVSWELGRFKARAFGELVRKAAELPWRDVLGPTDRLKVQAKAQRSRLRHTGAIAERILLAAAEATDRPVESLAPADDAEAPVLVRVQVESDRFTLAVDTSGEPLRRRGWRPDVGKAPLREDIARAMLLEAGVGVEDYEVLWDPFCGSGTIPIEAASILTGRLPGAGRHFAFESFPRFQELPPRPATGVHANATELWASDRDAGAVDRTQANAERAEVELQTLVAPMGRAVQPDWSERRGLLVANPPYGDRVGRGPHLRRLYAALGAQLRTLPRWEAALVGPDPKLIAATELSLEARVRADHGGRPVTVYTTRSDSRMTKG